MMSRRTARWVVATVAVALSVLLVWLLLSKPSYHIAGYDKPVTCPAVVNTMSSVYLSDFDTMSQWKVYDDFRSKHSTADPDGELSENAIARLVVVRACQDARLNRQTTVGLVVSAIVVLLAPLGLEGVFGLREYARRGRLPEPAAAHRPGSEKETNDR